MIGTPPPSEFDTTLTSRHECKYLLDERTAQAVRGYLESHAQLDPYSARSDDHRYRVFSFYLDSPGLRLYRDTEQGVRNRYKLRLRYYSADDKSPVFFEVKKRSDVIVRKNRKLVTTSKAEEFLRHGGLDLKGRSTEDLGEFHSRCQEVDARPALRVRYWREAWESRGVDPVRITFDTDVSYCILSSRGLIETRPDWQITPFALPVILEVKFTDLRPHWVDRMLTLFQLDKISVAKYAESINHIRASGKLRVLEARMQLAHSRRSGRRAI